MTTSLIISIVAIFVLVALSAFLSGSEIALFSLSATQLKGFRQHTGSAYRAVVHLLSEPRNLLVTLLMLNVSVNLGTQNVFSSLFGDHSGWILNVLVPLLVTVIFGELLPKSIAFSMNTQVALKTARPLSVAKSLFGAVRKLLTFIASKVSALSFFFMKPDQPMNAQAMRQVLTSAVEHKLLSPTETQFVLGSLKLEETLVREIMCPREDIVSLDVNHEDFAQFFRSAEYSRFPLIQDSLDHVLGIVSADVIVRHKHKIHSCKDLQRYVQTPVYVPETITLRSLLIQLELNNEHIALSVDEYGVISGLITKEDVIETIIGQIEDKPAEKPLFTQQGPDAVIASGKWELSELEQQFGVTLEDKENSATVGGYLTEKLGDIPKSGTKYKTKGLLFHVLSVTPSRVTRVYIRNTIKAGSRIS